MAGNRAGGKKAAETNRKRYGEDFYREMGREGGRIGRGTGFGSETVGRDGLTGPERASQAGSRGGKISRRPKGFYGGQS